MKEFNSSDFNLIISLLRENISQSDMLLALLKKNSFFSKEEIESIESDTPDKLLKKLTENSKIDDEKAKEQIKKVCEKYKMLKGFNKKHPVHQIISYLEYSAPSLRKNSLSNRIEINGKFQSEDDLNTIMLNAEIFMGKKYSVSKSKFYDILNSNLINTFHPIKEFFTDSKYKGKGELDKLLKSIKSPTGNEDMNANNPYLRVFFVKWLLGTVASVFEERAYNNLMLVVTGEQNIGKTRLLRDLLPKKLRRFFAEVSLDEKVDKDAAILLCENLIAFHDDIGDKTFTKWQDIKKTLDTDIYSIRKPYGRGSERMKRLSSFCATSNDTELLSDPTGNRRIIPVEINSIDYRLLNSVDKEQLWLEIYHEYHLKGFSHHLTQDEIKILNEATKKFTVTDAVQESILRFFSIPADDTNCQKLTATEIADFINRNSKRNIDPRSLGVRLKNLGFIQKTEANGASTKRVYYVTINQDL